MNLLVGLCAPLLVACAALPSETQTDVGTNQARRANDISGYVPIERKKRVAGLARRLVQEGIRAVKKFTNGAKELPPDRKPNFYTRTFATEKTRHFVKPAGTYDSALKQFDSLHPQDVRPFTMPGGAPGVAGNVGDRIIYVKSSHEAFGKPTVEIYKMNLLVGLCVPLLVACANLPSETQTDVGTNQNSREHEVSGYVPVERKKRVAVLARRIIKKGLRAVKKFTKGAQELPPDPKPDLNTRVFATDETRHFVKPAGTYDGALKQFRSLNPDKVSPFMTPRGAPGVVGTVGDRLIYVKSRHETIGNPTVEIYRMGGLNKGDPAKLTLTEIIKYGN